MHAQRGVLGVLGMLGDSRQRARQTVRQIVFGFGFGLLRPGLGAYAAAAVVPVLLPIKGVPAFGAAMTQAMTRPRR